MAVDSDALLALHEEYISCAQDSDVDRFRKILAPDFYCSALDGSPAATRSRTGRRD